MNPLNQAHAEIDRLRAEVERLKAVNVAPLTKAERSVVRSAERFQLDWDGKTLEDTYDTALSVAHAVCRLNTERAKTKGKKR